MCKQCAKEAQVEEVHVEENLETLMTKCNNLRVLKFNEKWKHGHPQVVSRGWKNFCSYCKEMQKEKKQKQIHLRM